jgi:hypothetical protein
VWSPDRIIWTGGLNRALIEFPVTKGLAMDLMTTLIEAVAVLTVLGALVLAGAPTPQAIPVRVRDRRRK